MKKTIEIGPVIENAVSLALTGSKIVAEVTIADDLPAVEADENQIGQVLNNLLINATQAMPRGGVVRVAANHRSIGPNDPSFLAEGRYVVVIIRDQGVGIPQKHLEKIFDPYFTTKDAGTGLGLTSAYSIMKKHGGDIRVSSHVGSGTAFELFLPASNQQAGDEPAPAPQTITAGKGCVLVMDDEEYIREMVTDMLIYLGYDAEACACGEELIQLYREKADQGRAPDAVIVDLTIRGGMGGLEAAGAILEIDPQARLIVASGYSTDPVIANFRDYGFTAALAKPFKMEDISNELATLLKTP